MVKVLQDIPTIETTAITLRKVKNEDAYDLFHYYNNENVYQYLDWNGPESTEDTDRIIRIWNRGFEEGWIIRFAITEKTTNKIIGTIFLIILKEEELRLVMNYQKIIGKRAL